MVCFNYRTFMEDSAGPANRSLPKVPEPDRAATSVPAKNEKGPKPGEHVPLLRIKRDHNKGFYSEKCQLEASTAFCFEWADYLVPRDVLPPFHNMVARTERCVQRTLESRPYFLRTKLFVGQGGRGTSVFRRKHTNQQRVEQGEKARRKMPVTNVGNQGNIFCKGFFLSYSPGYFSVFGPNVAGGMQPPPTPTEARQYSVAPGP